MKKCSPSYGQNDQHARSLWPIGIAKVVPIRLGHSNRVKQGLSVVQDGLVQRIPICNPTGTNVIIETSSIDADIDPFTKT
jgi:hypothetical protein